MAERVPLLQWTTSGRPVGMLGPSGSEMSEGHVCGAGDVAGLPFVVVPHVEDVDVARGEARGQRVGGRLRYAPGHGASGHSSGDGPGVEHAGHAVEPDERQLPHQLRRRCRHRHRVR